MAHPTRPSGLERVFFGTATGPDIDAWVAAAAAGLLGAPDAAVRFRAGRIDAVYGLGLPDGREVVLKLHRPPADLPALGAVAEVLDHLAATGYPCPRPLAGPVVRDGRVVTVQAFLPGGGIPDARRPDERRLLAAGLVEHVALLREGPEVAGRTGPGPAWTRYHGGPWPEPHDPVFDFSRTPPGWEWLDASAREAATDVRALRPGHPPVLAHGDWYAGNVRVADGRIVAVFDWDLVAEPEPVVAGLSAGGLLVDGAPTADEVAAFLADHRDAGGARPGRDGWRLAAAAARWVLAFNARCDLAMLTGDPDPGSALGRLLADREAYRALGR
jgi:hypothetical protein